MTEQLLEGQKITKIHTLGSMYDQNSIVLVDEEGKPYRMKVEELFKIVNDLTFKLKKNRKHTYLIIHHNTGWEEEVIP